MQLLKVICILVALVTVNQAHKVRVTTTLGTLIGTSLNTTSAKDIMAFRGIRYALAPILNLRFRNPKPYPAWKPNIYNATLDGPMCPQVTANINDISEDCLRLNVYTRDTRALKPVVVYLHPGGPAHLMDRDIVLVTMNYRLGTLGSLAVGSSEAPGNAGLKDQVMALRWVQHHIDSFGGDPNSVTLLGEGSFNIGLHILSPMSKGLFHRAIMLSSSPLGQFEYETQQKRLSDKQAELLKCPKEPAVALVDCLKLKTMLDFVNTQQRISEFNNNRDLNLMPVIESDFRQERFLVEHPFKTLQSENFTAVPLIIGITQDEFVSRAYYLLKNETVRTSLNNNFEKYAPTFFMHYLLRMPVNTPSFTKNKPESTTERQTLTQLWTELAKKSNPNNPRVQILRNFRWPSYTSDGKPDVVIDSSLTFARL